MASMSLYYGKCTPCNHVTLDQLTPNFYASSKGCVRAKTTPSFMMSAQRGIFLTVVLRILVLSPATIK